MLKWPGLPADTRTSAPGRLCAIASRICADVFEPPGGATGKLMARHPAAPASVKARTSVARHLRVHLERPCVYPARHVVDVLETLRQEVGRRLLAALAVVAVEVERRRFV